MSLTDDVPRMTTSRPTPSVARRWPRLWRQRGACALLALAIASAAGAAPSTARRPADAPAPAPTPAPAAQAAPLTAPADGAGRLQSTTFAQLGLRESATLQRTHQRHRFYFAVRSDELVTQAQLRLDLKPSPILAGRAAVLEVRLNDEVLGRIDIPPEVASGAQGLRRVLPIDPRLVTDQNELVIGFADPVSCDTPTAAGIWTQISPTSTLDLQLAPLPLSDNLALLPVPFFDHNDSRPADVALVLSGQAANPTLQAAGNLASWIGAQAGYRGARLHVHDRLPAGHAIVLATPRDAPAGVALPPVAGATVTLAAHPENPAHKVLYLLGRDGAELRRAVDALVLGQLPAHGATALVDRVAEPGSRRPYDAPNWTPTHRPVRFDELVSGAALVATGTRPDAIDLAMRLPPDLFPWRQRNIPIDLRLRHTALPQTRDAAVQIRFNGEVVREESLMPSRTSRWFDRLQQQIWERNDDPQTRTLHRTLRIPVAQLGTQSHAKLQLMFQHGPVDDLEECQREASGAAATPPDLPRSVVDGASTIDFSSAPHYLPMPDLAAFANAGHPFTRYADLAETAVVLPDSPAREEVAAYLNVMARMGEATGYPARRVAVTRTREVGQFADRDLIVIGSAGAQPLFTDWAEHMPMHEQPPPDDGREHSARPAWLHGLMVLWQRERHPPLPPLSWRNADAQAALAGFESPLTAGRSVVALMAATPDMLALATDGLREPQRLASVHGHVTLFADNGRVTHHEADPTYASGELPWLTWLRWQLSAKPILLWLVLLLSIAALSWVLYVMLRWHAQRRHAGAAL